MICYIISKWIQLHRTQITKKPHPAQTNKQKKRQCQLYLGIFSESSKAEIKAYDLQTCFLTGV